MQTIVITGANRGHTITRKDITEQATMERAAWADMIQLERKGNTYTLYASRFGEPFVIGFARKAV